MHSSVDSFSISNGVMQRPQWQTVVIFALAFWLSSSLILDLVIMPSLYAAGMMSQPGFAAAGYAIFWLFNRIELLCAAVALTGVLALRYLQPVYNRKGHAGAVLAAILVAIALLYTYALTPQMSALGMELNLFNTAIEIPVGMNQLHGSYWALELLKFASGGLLLNLCYRERV
ncbi:DUF4149 domain-containing protein [Trichocoleus desertorum AS-A10]|uniref:DUF4149 domain-containing protein n=1 Tax=Trichocoleus desertorum TaxID=1481672 RepID=UPI00329A3B8A